VPRQAVQPAQAAPGRSARQDRGHGSTDLLGKARLAQQIRLIERLEAAGTRTDLANSLLHEIGQALRTMRASRTILCQQLETYQG
jgi:hypothetical protein